MKRILFIILLFITTITANSQLVLRINRFLVDSAVGGVSHLWLDTSYNPVGQGHWKNIGASSGGVGGNDTAYVAIEGLNDSTVLFLHSNRAIPPDTLVINSSGGGGGGNVTKVGTPVNNQVGVWTGDGTIEGDTDLTFDGTALTAPTVVYGGGGQVSGTSFGVQTATYTNSAGTNPSVSFGLELGWNMSGGQGEVNLVWGSVAGSSKHLEFGYWNGGSYATAATLSTSGVFVATAGLATSGTIYSSSFIQTNGFLFVAEQATPSTPASGWASTYPKTDGNFYSINDAGVEMILSNPTFTPANSTDATYGNGTMTTDDTYLYFRTSTGTWKKIAWAAF